MAKRFTDSEKYKKPFHRGLQGAYKILWDFICHDCDHAGIWHIDFEVAQIYIGLDMPVNEIDSLKYFNEGEKRIEVLPGGKWFIRPFIEFQYGVLNPDNRVHLSILNILKKNKIKPLISPLLGAKDKDKDKDMDKDKDKTFSFDEIWSRYPKKDGKKESETHFNAHVKTDKDWRDINKALDNYLRETKDTKRQFIKNGSTWFNNWKDWINHKPEETKSDFDDYFDRPGI